MESQPLDQTLIPETFTEPSIPARTTYACIVDDQYICLFRSTCYIDWYRHLKGAHPDVHTRLWLCCGERSDHTPGDICHIGFSNLGLFKAHRKSCHMDPPTTADDDYLVGSFPGVRYYCGFCKAVFPTLKRCWWHSRAQHIAKHFEDGATYTEYTHMDVVDLLDASCYLPREGLRDESDKTTMGITGC
jgi:hypothetical protein